MRSPALFVVGAAMLLVLAVRQAYAKPVESISTANGEGAGTFGDLFASLYDLGGLMGGMTLSAEGIEAIKLREGFSPKKYRDASGWSIGYGHFIKPWENYDDGIDPGTAESLLANDIASAAGAVNLRVSVPLTQSQFDALVSFAYNVGVGAFAGSTLLQRLNAGDYAGAQAQFGRWVFSTMDGIRQQNPSLIGRRASEAMQFGT